LTEYLTWVIGFLFFLINNLRFLMLLFVLKLSVISSLRFLGWLMMLFFLIYSSWILFLTELLIFFIDFLFILIRNFNLLPLLIFLLLLPILAKVLLLILSIFRRLIFFQLTFYRMIALLIFVRMVLLIISTCRISSPSTDTILATSKFVWFLSQWLFLFYIFLSSFLLRLLMLSFIGLWFVRRIWPSSFGIYIGTSILLIMSNITFLRLSLWFACRIFYSLFWRELSLPAYGYSF
jgi:hypothetical protein